MSRARYISHRGLVLLCCHFFNQLVNSYSTGDWCYKEPKNRSQKLNFHFSSTTEHHDYHPSHENGSKGCPFVLAKYDCLMKGDFNQPLIGQNGKYAQSLKYTPRDGCELANIHSDPTIFADIMVNKRLLFFGDSLVLQVLTSMACQSFPHLNLNLSNITWGDGCKSGVFKCSKANIHKNNKENYTPSELYLDGGGIMKFYDFRESANIFQLHDFGLSGIMDGDTILVQRGNHELTMNNMTHALIPVLEAKLSLKNVRLIWMATPQPNFFKPFNRSEDHSKEKCVPPEFPLVPEMDELNIARVNISGKSDLLINHLSGVLAMDGYGDALLPHAKVAGGDCVHFCIPGPPDNMANMLFTMLRVFDEGNTSITSEDRIKRRQQVQTDTDNRLKLINKSNNYNEQVTEKVQVKLSAPHLVLNDPEKKPEATKKLKNQPPKNINQPHSIVKKASSKNK